MPDILKVSGLRCRFGGLKAVDDVSFSVARGDILGLIGPNGAGKTTLFNLLVGLAAAQGGRIELDGRDVTGLRPHRIAALGMTKTFQNVALFPEMTVLDNVLVGGLLRHDVPRARQLAAQCLDRVGLSAIMGKLAADLSFPEQARVELARALCTGPRVFLLDEVMAALNDAEMDALLDLIRTLRDESGISFIVVEHHMRAIMRLCNRIMVLSFGQKIAEGAPAEIAANPTVIEVYLGNPWKRRRWQHESVADPGADRRLRSQPGAARRVAGGSGRRLRGSGRRQHGGQEHAAALRFRIAGQGRGQHPFRRAGNPARAAHRIPEFGIAHVPEGRHVFRDMTVEENLYLGGYVRRRDMAALARERDRIYALFPRLGERRRQLAGTLSGGEQQMVAFGRALMLAPRLLLLDEPSHGLAPKVVEEMHQAMVEIHRSGLTILLVEQNTRLALSVAEHAYVLQSGPWRSPGTTEN